MRGVMMKKCVSLLNRISNIPAGILLFFLTTCICFGGTITVNSTGDFEANDQYITLREAIKIANGTRIPYDHPTDPDEMDHISGTYGLGITDVISVALGDGETISLSDYLPTLDDTNPDSISAGSLVVLDGSGLSEDPLKFAIHFKNSQKTVSGFTLSGFPGIAVFFSGDHNTLQHTIIDGATGTGIKIFGSGAQYNTVSNCDVRNGSLGGIDVSSGAHNNLITNTFVHGNGFDGIAFRGSETTSNTMILCGIGMSPVFVEDGNSGYGLVVQEGANNNYFGDKNDHNNFTYISNNSYGGILVDGSGTDHNMFHSMFIGTDDTTGKFGNGSGHGIEVRNGAKNNTFGIEYQAGFGIGGHTGNGILVTGVGTDGNVFQRIFVGEHPITRAEIGNAGHGIELADGVKNTTLGGQGPAGRQIEVNHTGAGKHGIFINGTNATHPIENTDIGLYHLGEARQSAFDDPSIQGDTIHITGNVNNVTVGATHHDNSTNGAAGYGVYLEGPNVRNVQLVGIFCGYSDLYAKTAPNDKGGVYIGSGAHHITVSTQDDSGISFIAANSGPGITIDASNPAQLPHDILIQNTVFGLNYWGQVNPNNGDGIFVKGPDSGDPLVLTNVRIGRDDMNAENTISGNAQNGIRLKNVANVNIYGNKIGTTVSGILGKPNEQNGILLDHCKNCRIGSSTTEHAPNIISGNDGSGIRITGQTEEVYIKKNKIGTQLDENDELPNETHGIHVDGASKKIEIDDNIIRFNNEHGIMVEGTGTQVKITKNSIHRNMKEGIRVKDGGNGDIKAPVLYREDPKRALTDLKGKTIPNGNLEVFADPPESDTGYWGQGKTYIKNLTADNQGLFTIPLTFADKGTITVTVRDSQDRTSEFSPMLTVQPIQTVYQDPPLLVEGKTTVFRVFADSGMGGTQKTVTGQLKLGDKLQPAPKENFIMRGINDYARPARAIDRKRAKNTLNFYVEQPPKGTMTAEIIIRENDTDRARIELKNLQIQKLNKLKTMIVPLIIKQGPVYLGPDYNAIIEMLRYISSVYPVNSREFLASIRLQGVVLDFPPQDDIDPDYRWKTAQEVRKIRDATVLPDGSHPEYASGILDKSILVKNSAGDELNGYAYPNLKLTVSIDRYDTTNLHTGGTLCHEIGHTDPFLLGDTYGGGRAKAVNPLPTDPGKFSASGIYIFEEEFAYNPSGIVRRPPLSNPGPLWKDPANNVHDMFEFMGNADTPRWVDKTTDKVLFTGLGGVVPGAGAKDNMKLSQSVAPALIVSGFITTDNQVTLNPLDHVTTSVLRNGFVDDYGIVYTAELLNASDQVLDSQDFTVVFSMESFGSGFSGYEALTSAPFYVVLHDHPDGVKIVIKKETMVLYEFLKSASPPSVTLISPQGPGDLPGEIVNVEWNATDSDLDDVHIDIFYTPDGGTTRYPVAADLVSTSSKTVYTPFLPSGPSPRFIVKGSDGWNTGEDMSSNALTVPDRDPMVKISYPSSGDQFEEGEMFSLFGSAYDPEDGILMDDSLVWTLDSDPLATGMEPAISLEEGEYTIRLTATDSYGNEVFDEVTVNVEPYKISAADILDYLTGRTDIEPADADLNEDGNLDIGDVVKTLM
jgi:hypothetical protein